MQMHKNIGLKTIAIELNTSVNTVSRALRDCSDIGEKTKQQVRDKAIELGYVPNAIAKSLKNGKSGFIGIVIDNLINPYFSIMSNLLVSELKNNKYLGVLIPVDKLTFDRSTISQCISQRVDGIISFVEPTQDAVDTARLNNIPLLLLGRIYKDKYVKCVYTNDFKGGTLAAKYLIEKNKKKILYVGVEGVECAIRRYNGLKSYINEYNEEKNESITYKYVDYEEFMSNAHKLIHEYDGFFSFNDEIASNVYCLAKEEEILDKVNIVGYDCLYKNLNIAHNISSIEYDYKKIAVAATNLIVELTNDNTEHLNKKIEPFNVVLYVGLI